jgi:tungstate transport system ATP-binding protein
MSEPLIALRGVGVSFGLTQALRGVDLQVRAGECIAFVGANGSGKSTLLRVLHGLQAPSVGVREAMALRCAMVFQQPFLLRLSVRANIALGLWFARVPRSQWPRRIDDALHHAGVADLAQRNARRLSFGQQQRVALARAWAIEPQVLLLDEPTASLDPTAKREVEAFIQRFAHQGTTLLMTSHNLGQVKRLASRVVYLEQGRALADAPVDRFFAADGPAAAAQFLRGELPWF